MFTVGYDELAVAIWVSTGGMGDVGECTDDETWRRERPRFRLRLDLNSSDGIASEVDGGNVRDRLLAQSRLKPS